MASPSSEAPARPGRARHRVAVTGTGLWTSTVAGTEAFLAVLDGGRAAPPQDEALTDAALLARFPKLKPKYLDETAKYAILAAAEALASAGLERGDGAMLPGNDEIGIAMGTLSGPIKWGFEHGYIEAAIDFDNPRVSAASSIVAYYGSLIGNVTIPLRIAGPSIIFCNLDVAGADAIGYAYEAVRHGKSPVMVAGGADAPVTPMIEIGIERAGVLLRGQGRQQLMTGAATLVLEEWEHARARGAGILAEVVGYATTTAAGGHVSGRQWVDKATAVWPIDCVMTTGVAAHERSMLAALFGGEADVPPVSDVTWAAGYTAGAAGAVQAIASVLLLGRGRLPRGPLAAAAGGANSANRTDAADTADTADTASPALRPGAAWVDADGARAPARTILQTTSGLSRKTSMLLYHVAEPTS